MTITPDRKIWMVMAIGGTCPTTVRHGSRMLIRGGLRTARATGFGSRIGDGHGFLPSLGDGRRTTMGAGSSTTARGDGGLDRCTGIRTIVRCGRRLMCRSLATAADLALASAGDGDRLDGSRLDLVTFSIRGGAVGADGSVTQDSVAGSAGALLRCTVDRASRMCGSRRTIRISAARPESLQIVLVDAVAL